jgi:hypothetical protein
MLQPLGTRPGLEEGCWYLKEESAKDEAFSNASGKAVEEFGNLLVSSNIQAF